MANESTLSAERAVRSLGIVYNEDSGRGLTHPFFVLVINAFKLAAEAHGYSVTFINSEIAGSRLSFPEYCRISHLSGVCIVCADYSSPAMKELVTSGIPSITVDHVYKHVPAVLSDNETGVQKLLDYAISRGHRRIAFLYGQNNSIVTRTRIEQFQNAMAYNGIPILPGFLREGRYNDIGYTRRHVAELLSLPLRPTCILLPDDLTFLGAQDAARELSCRIPEDISFMGYDGIPTTQALIPRLTTIRQDTDKMGQEAAERLINLIEHPDTANRMPSIFPVSLIEGGTVRNLLGD